ncbi:ABC transporter ATP-binding protein [Georgenia sp. SUBG003]|uniref:ABC transporter ATP-binding protein n=1 Tax=Georgenia sp. SUBG003 TaxID=1497974 RepID=UPI003AB57DAC
MPLPLDTPAGASFDASSGAPDGAATAPALRVAGLRKTYGAREVVRGLSFTAARGALTAVLGPNGAGKTTTIECCEGLRRPDGGSLEVLGLDRLQRASDAELRKRVGVMLQDGGLPLAPRARSVLTHVARLHDRPADPDRLLARLGLTDVATTPVRRLSGGQRQRLALAVALVGRPELVFLDEPSAGLDPHSRLAVWDLLRELRDGGTSIVLTTHLMSEAEELADRVVVIDAGRVVAEGSPAELVGPPELRVTRRRPRAARRPPPARPAPPRRSGRRAGGPMRRRPPASPDGGRRGGPARRSRRRAGTARPPRPARPPRRRRVRAAPPEESRRPGRHACSGPRRAVPVRP